MEYLNCAISALENQHFVIYIFKLRKIIQVLMFQTLMCVSCESSYV